MKVEEKQFDLEYINKYASQMTIGNGFFGIRGSQEEDYRNQVRGMFAAGVYNRPLGAESAGESPRCHQMGNKNRR